MDPLQRLRNALAGRYRVEGLVGEGGMALVFRAQDLKHRRPVAIKVLRPEVSAALGRERFLREIEVVARLTHPNILSLHDSGEEDGLLYFVMPFVDGPSLRTRLGNEGKFSVEEALRITQEVGDAISFAHGKGLVHRDIKPENILFQAGHAMVCDFGIAQATTEAGDRLTRTGIAVGTFTYMSPEQLGGEGGVDGRTDIYSLGCLLHEMLTGSVPYEADTPQASLAKKLMGPVPNTTEAHPDVPPTVQEVLNQTLAIQAKDRFDTAQAFIQALEEAMTASAVEAHAQRRRSQKRIRRGVQGAAIAFLSGILWWLSTLGGGPDMDRIAVLPLIQERGDTAQEYFIQGVHQDLVLELSRAGLRVIAPSSVARYAETELSVGEIARELGVDGVIVGEANLATGSIGLLLTLVDGATDEIVWSETFQESSRNVKTLYREATRAVASWIGYELSEEAEARLTSSQEVDPQVYDALLQARFHWQKLTAEGLDTAERYYRLALKRDSTSAEAWAGVGRMWSARAQMGLISVEEARQKGSPFRERAEELDPSLSTLQAQLATTLAWGDWDWAGSDQAFQRALEADPTDSLLRAYYSHLLLHLDRDEEALAQVEQAAQTDPFNTLVQGLYGMAMNFLHRYEEAEAVLLQAQTRDPEAPILLSTLRTTYHLMGRHEDAIRMWRASYQALGDSEALEALNTGYQEGGYTAALRAVAEMFVTRTETSGTFVTPWQVATLYLRGGVSEPALDYLELAMEARDGNMPYISVDPIFDPIRNEPRFQALVDSLGLPR